MATMTSAMTSSPAAARMRMLAGERRRGSANGGHQHVEGDAAILTEARTAASSDQTTMATRKKRQRRSA
jgi:hypothetical protein